MNSLDKKHAIITVAICFIIAVIEGIDIQAAGIAGVAIGEHFGLDKSQLGIFFSAGILGLLPGGLIGGRFADQIGRKKVLIWSVAVFAIFTLMTVWVESFYGLLAVRFLAGAGLGAAMPNLIALAAEAVTEQNRGRAVTLMYAGMPLGAALISFIARLDIGADWKNIFYIGGFAPLVVIPLMIWFLPESKVFLDQKDTKAKVAENEVPQEGIFKKLFGREHISKTLLLGISYFLTLMVVYIMLSWLPSLFKELGFSRQQGSTAQFFFMISAAVGTVLLGVLLDSWKKSYVIILMYGGIVLGLFGLNAASGLNEMYIAAIVCGAFVIGCQGVLYALGSMVYPTDVRATGVGTVSSIGRIGAMAGPMVAGQLLTLGYGATGVISACIPGIIISAICMLIVMRKVN